MEINKRTRIGLYYVKLCSWMGGVFYAQNLLKALNLLDDEDKPFIDVYCHNIEPFERLKNSTQYPYLNVIIIHDNLLWKRVYRKIIKFLFGNTVGAQVNMFKLNPLDQLIYPYEFGKDKEKLVCWKPDFQERYLPWFFSSKEIKERNNGMIVTVDRNLPIVFSSYDSEKDFRKFYPNCHNKTFVVHFAVSHENFLDINIIDLKKKYNIKGDYLLCANQFWKHKNHLFLFGAYNKALQQGFNIKLVCTGNLSDYRHPEYINEVKDYLNKNNLNDHVSLLGLIDTKELYCLMKNSYAVVQPSLFEGWNTTVEDCKALNKFIFLSNIPVHQEQSNNNVCFFDPHDENDLVKKLLEVKPVEVFSDYHENIREFGKSFLNVINYVRLRNDTEC